MNIGLVVNARGKMCLVHDECFTAVPSWVAYHVDSLQLEVMFSSGDKYPLDWRATYEMDDYLRKLDKILIIRMEDKKPVEGYDTSLVQICNQRFVEAPAELADGTVLKLNRRGDLCLLLRALQFDEPPDGLEYQPNARLLSLTWRDGRHEALSTVPKRKDVLPENLNDHGILLFRERQRLWGQIYEQGSSPDPARTKEKYLRTEEIDRELGGLQPNSDVVTDYHEYLLEHTYVRVLWSPPEKTSSGDAVAGFDLFLPIMLSM